MLKKTIFKSTHTKFGSCLAQAFHDCPFDANKMENAPKLKILSQNYEKNQSNTRSNKKTLSFNDHQNIDKLYNHNSHI